jgi:Family of unknown function (DUF5640)
VRGVRDSTGTGFAILPVVWAASSLTGRVFNTIWRCNVLRSYRSILAVLGIAVLLVGVALAFAGCGGGGGTASVVGKWNSAADKETVEFRADGTMTVETPDGKMDFKYTAAGGKLTLTVEGADPIPATYKLSGDELTVTGEGGSGGPASTTYKRMK